MGLKASKLSRSVGSLDNMSNARGGSCRHRCQAKKGYVPVCVGLGTDSRRFMIKASFLNDASVSEFLEESAREYGFRNPGVLKIPCDVKRFEERMLARVGQRSLRILALPSDD